MATKKYNIILRIQEWITGRRGQLFLHYAYNWGAAIVVLGTLFKLNHLPSANLVLYIGMGTEVFVFFISAFDVPATHTGNGLSEESLAPTGQPVVHKTDRELYNSMAKVKQELGEMQGQLRTLNRFVARVIKVFSLK